MLIQIIYYLVPYASAFLLTVIGWVLLDLFMEPTSEVSIILKVMLFVLSLVLGNAITFHRSLNALVHKGELRGTELENIRSQLANISGDMNRINSGLSGISDHNFSKVSSLHERIVAQNNSILSMAALIAGEDARKRIEQFNAQASTSPLFMETRQEALECILGDLKMLDRGWARVREPDMCPNDYLRFLKESAEKGGKLLAVSSASALGFWDLETHGANMDYLQHGEIERIFLVRRGMTDSDRTEIYRWAQQQFNDGIDVVIAVEKADGEGKAKDFIIDPLRRVAMICHFHEGYPCSHSVITSEIDIKNLERTYNEYRKYYGNEFLCSRLDAT